MTALGCAFVVFGAFWGGWAVAAIDVERFLGLSHTGFGLLLAAAIVAAGVVNAVGGALTERLGAGPVLTRALVAWAVLLAVTGSVRSPIGFAICFVMTVAVGGLVDVVMNVSAASAFSGRPGHLMQFHGLFNAGTVVGALITGLSLHAGWSWRVLWGIDGVLALGTAVACWRATLPSPAVDAAAFNSDGTAAGGRGLVAGWRSLRAANLAGLALVFACGALLEGGIETWGVLALRAQLAITALAGAGAYVIGQTLATAARIGLGRHAGALGGAAGAAVGATLAAIGLVIEAVSPQPVVAAAGLALAAVGASCCWPLLLAHAIAGRERQGVIVGRISAAGYFGFVGGPPIIGWIAGSIGLRPALVVLAAVGVVVATSPWHGARVHGTDSEIRGSLAAG